ncbi:nitrogen fixation protein NifM [Shewanella yunxiaonensis]|uniref:peptidylprolyl isomerase n=1 Tax=Shewanella yunxiaonensis TaxID=2829809 RepID=A0ABX7YRS0_9GAMM|nr:nitrogen fixation protein NifM [Shewanella yunxiaonensis]QUN05332.1 nitrogen fixation protein NifM [Shewanella yunxiaonensis]
METQKQRYLTAKVATERFNLNPEFLSATQQTEVQLQVKQLGRLQQAILGAKEAAGVVLAPQQLDAAVAECAARFESAEAFAVSLAKQGLSEPGFRAALYDELLCEVILDKIAADVPPLSRKQAYEYYLTHQQQFSRGRLWYLKQILITINNDYAENQPDNARSRIRHVRELADSKDFAALALQYSECPSAMEQGLLGWCEESKLFPEIAAALPALQPGEVSAPIETELGFHLVLYTEMKPAKVASFHEAFPLLAQRHNERAKKYLQKQWLNTLMA